MRAARTWARVRPEDVGGLSRRPGTAPLPSVSVVIPAFDAEATIVESVMSAALQTHPDLEIVAVDDGSTDGTAALLGRLAAVVPRLTWFTQANGGLSAARNAGLGRAAGEFVLFHDADDVLHRGAAAALALAARDAGADVVAGVFRIVEERSAAPVRAFMAREEVADFKADAVAAMRHCTNLSLCNKLLRRDHLLARGLRFRDGLSMQDVELWLRMMFDLRSFVQLPMVVADYVQAASSNSRQRRPARFESVFRLFDLVEEHYEARGWTEHRLFAHCAILQGVVGFFLRWKLEDGAGRATPDLLRLQALLRRIPPEHFCHYHARKNAGAGGLAAVLAREGRFAGAAALMADPSRHKRHERNLIPTFAALLAHAEALVVPTVAA